MVLLCLSGRFLTGSEAHERTPPFPIEINIRGWLVRIFKRVSKKCYESFVVAYHQDGKRKHEELSDFAKAKKRVRKLAEALSRGGVAAASLKLQDQRAYLNAKKLLKPTRVTLEAACHEYVEAFNVVSADDRVAVSISACGGVTTGGNKATPKMHKIRSDMLFLLLADVTRRIVVFSCAKMHALCEAELRGCRLPTSVEIVFAQVPSEMETALAVARLMAARHVSPGGVGI